MGAAVDAEQQLRKVIASFVYDPLGFVRFVFPWGEKGRGLEGQKGPDEWQANILKQLGDDLQEDPERFIQYATASGHGIGKTALVAWVVLWFVSTRPQCAGVVTANTLNQLTKKTWREVSVWHKRMINRHWFTWTATSFSYTEQREDWGVNATPWSEANEDAFAGLHAKHVLVVFDEASAISDRIWEVTEGAMTTQRAIWLVFGNPTKNTGRFRECFGKYRHRWKTRQVDSRSCKMTNKAKIQEWIEDHGEDSDFVRVRVRGEFPRFGTNQLISSEDVANARDYLMPVDEYDFHSVCIGVDVARFGSDESVITIRQGRKVHEQRVFRGLDNVQIAAHTSAAFRECTERPVIFVDGVGVGAGTVDILRAQGYPVFDVNAGAKAFNEKLYYNKRAEMWDRMREWLTGSVDLPNDPVLCDQLVALEYEYDLKERIKLETKDDLKERLSALGSPDRADSLALTFAELVAPVMLPDSFEPDIEWDD